MYKVVSLPSSVDINEELFVDMLSLLPVNPAVKVKSWLSYLLGGPVWSSSWFTLVSLSINIKVTSPHRVVVKSE